VLTSQYEMVDCVWLSICLILVEGGRGGRGGRGGVKDIYSSVMLTYLPTYLHTYMDVNISRYIYVYPHTYMHTCIHTYHRRLLALCGDAQGGEDGTVGRPQKF